MHGRTQTHKCVCVSEWRKERSDEATLRGVRPRMVRQRKRQREMSGNKRWKRGWKDVDWG